MNSDYFEVHFPKGWSEARAAYWLDRRVPGHQVQPHRRYKKACVVRLMAFRECLRMATGNGGE